MIQNLVRKNILQLQPYSSARDEFKGEAEVYLDANENPYPTLYNRYPDPLQLRVKEKVSKLKGIEPAQIFLGNGSDEAIDLLIRVFCEPNQDSILITEPTYGMYAVCAGINAVSVQRASLTPDFAIDLESILKTVTTSTKIIFLCSPNNPTGNLLEKGKIETLVQKFSGIVVVDEAYIDFANDPGFIEKLKTYPNLVILQTLSKAWGLAGLRVGMCFASEEIIALLNKIKYPYNINSFTQQKALEILKNVQQKDAWVAELVEERKKLERELEKLAIVKNVYPSDANFLLVRTENASDIYNILLEQKIIVRDRSRIELCENCLRITVGTATENNRLLTALKKV